MSFSSDDMNKLQEYINRDPNISSLFQKLLEAHEFELHKICHEIRTPLTILYSTLQLIESQHPETKDFLYWDSLSNDIDYMLSLLKKLSEFNNSSNLTVQSFALRPFIEKLVLSFASSCADSDIEFTSEVSTLPNICGDSVKLRQALLNLLKNAKESINGKGSIFFRAYCDYHSVFLDIRDTGCGIPKENLDKIFTPFLTTKSSGTGLGLPVSLKIIQAHHGTLSVDSVPGSGTTFRITLPIQ